MAIEINDALQTFSPKALDNKYLKHGIAPYASVNDVNQTILPEYRSICQMVIIDINGVNTLYWYRQGIEDTDLVIFSPSAIVVDGNSIKLLPGTLIDKILVLDVAPVVLNIGSAINDTDLLEGQYCKAPSYVIDWVKYFDQAETIYFSGINPTTTLKIYIR